MLTNLYDPQAFMAEIARRALSQNDAVILHAPDPVKDPPKLALQLQDACVLARAYLEDARNSQDKMLLEAAYRSLLESQRIFENELALLAGCGHAPDTLWQQLAELESLLYELGAALGSKHFCPSDNHRN